MIPISGNSSIFVPQLGLILPGDIYEWQFVKMHMLQLWWLESDYDSDGWCGQWNTETDSNHKNENNNNHQSLEEDNLQGAPATEYSIMHNLGIHVDLSISHNANYVKSLLGELHRMHTEYRERKNDWA